MILMSYLNFGGIGNDLTAPTEHLVSGTHSNARVQLSLDQELNTRRLSTKSTSSEKKEHYRVQPA